MRFLWGQLAKGNTYTGVLPAARIGHVGPGHHQAARGCSGLTWPKVIRKLGEPQVKTVLLDSMGLSSGLDFGCLLFLR